MPDNVKGSLYLLAYLFRGKADVHRERLAAANVGGRRVRLVAGLTDFDPMRPRAELNDYAFPAVRLPSFAVDQHLRIRGLHAHGDRAEPIAWFDLQPVAVLRRPLRHHRWRTLFALRRTLFSLRTRRGRRARFVRLAG